MMRIWQTFRCGCGLIFYGTDERDAQRKVFREEIAAARHQNRMANTKLTKVMADLLKNLDYDRIVQNDGVLPLDRK